MTDHGVKGIFVTGTTGEFVNLTIEERKKLLVSTRQSVPSDVTVMFNATAMNKEDIAQLCRWGKQEGADAISFTAPYYHKYDAKAMVEYFKTCTSIAGSMPVYLYNMSGMTGNPITPEILKDVVDNCKNVKGIKDSSMDFMNIMEYKKIINDDTFEILTGNDAQVLYSLCAGAVGALIALSGIFPQLSVSIYQDFLKGDIEHAKSSQDTLMELRSICRKIMPIMAHKAMLSLQGFEMGPARFPMRNLTQEEIKYIETQVNKLEII